MAKDFNRYFLQDDIRGEKNAQSWSREKYTTRYHFTYTRTAMFFLFFFAHAESGILVTDQGSKLCFLQWKHRVLTTGLPEKLLG